jgi:HK97 family phage prohead protease
MDKITKLYVTKQDEDGWYIASTPDADRDNDRIMPMGISTDNFEKNPVILWAHDYRSPHAVIGKAAEIRKTDDDLRFRPEFREPVNDSDPMSVIQALIDQKLVRATSIGFMPKEFEENDVGGLDFTDVDLLEISMVPVPANQQALQLAVKALVPAADRVSQLTDQELEAIINDLPAMKADNETPADTESADNEPSDDTEPARPERDITPNPEPESLTAQQEAAISDATGVLMDTVREIIERELSHGTTSD